MLLIARINLESILFQNSGIVFLKTTIFRIQFLQISQMRRGGGGKTRRQNNELILNYHICIIRMR